MLNLDEVQAKQIEFQFKGKMYVASDPTAGAILLLNRVIESGDVNDIKAFLEQVLSASDVKEIFEFARLTQLQELLKAIFLSVQDTKKEAEQV